MLLSIGSERKSVVSSVADETLRDSSVPVCVNCCCGGGPCRNPGIDGYKWPLFSPTRKDYVTIDTKPSHVGSRLKADRCHFWNVDVPKILLSGEGNACSHDAHHHHHSSSHTNTNGKQVFLLPLPPLQVNRSPDHKVTRRARVSSLILYHI